MKQSTVMKTRNYGKFADVLREQPKQMMLYHDSSRPKSLVTLKEIGATHPDELSPATMKMYTSMGMFPHPVAMCATRHALAYLYDAREIAEFFKSRKRPSQQEIERMLERSRELAAASQRLRYKAKKFQVTIKESK